MRDRDVRIAVKAYLERIHEDDPDTIIVEEMGVWSGSARVDIAVINGEICGFELKSDRDTLDRLSVQADIYNRVFDEMTLVVGQRHAEKAIQMVPEWWSIFAASQTQDKLSLTELRVGHRNPTQDAALIAELLWKGEALNLLSFYNLDRGWRTKRIKFLHQRLADELTLDELKAGVRKALKARKGWLGQH